VEAEVVQAAAVEVVVVLVLLQEGVVIVGVGSSRQRRTVRSIDAMNLKGISKLSCD